MEWIQIGNRAYKLEDDKIMKAVYDDEREVYIKQPDEWPQEGFIAHEQVYDGNTENNYNKIVKQLDL